MKELRAAEDRAAGGADISGSQRHGVESSATKATGSGDPERADRVAHSAAPRQWPRDGGRARVRPLFNGGATRRSIPITAGGANHDIALDPGESVRARRKVPGDTSRAAGRPQDARVGRPVRAGGPTKNASSTMTKIDRVPTRSRATHRRARRDGRFLEQRLVSLAVGFRVDWFARRGRLRDAVTQDAASKWSATNGR